MKATPTPLSFKAAKALLLAFHVPAWNMWGKEKPFGETDHPWVTMKSLTRTRHK